MACNQGLNGWQPQKGRIVGAERNAWIRYDEIVDVFFGRELFLGLPVAANPLRVALNPIRRRDGQ